MVIHLLTRGIPRHRCVSRNPNQRKRASWLRIEELENRLVLSGDMVLRWNSILLSAIQNSGQSPVAATRTMAIVQAAVYEAVNSIDQSFASYLVDMPAPSSANEDAAAAQAAHDALVGLFPAQGPFLDLELKASLQGIPDGDAKTWGIRVGQAAAEILLAVRAHDNSDAAVNYTPGTQSGDWQPTPPTYGPPEVPQWSLVTPFTLQSGSQFRPPAPPDLTSADYTAAFQLTQDLGSFDSTSRTADQTEAALFWYGVATPNSTPAAAWNLIAQQVAVAEGNTLVQNARLFALLNMAEADTAIASWDAKYTYNFWRPVTAIRAADTAGNPDIQADPNWTPLLTTPNSPSYPSAVSSESTAAATVLAAFFGSDAIPFSLSWNGQPGETRAFRSFSDAAHEAGLSGVWAGVQWSFDVSAGEALGQAIGTYVFQNVLQSRTPMGTGPLPAVTVGLTADQVAHADPVINWNATMLRAIWTAATPPTLTSRVEAMVAVAVYDAVDGIHPLYQLYAVPGLDTEPASDASPEAAAIAAADTMLNSLYPDQKALFDLEYQVTMAGIPNDQSRADGIAWGQTVANAVLAWRSQDGWNNASDYQPAPAGGTPGVYELTPNAGLEGKPPGYLAALGPQWGQVTPWAMTSLDQFLPPPPPALDSPEYAAAFNEVKSLGATDSTTRTADETLYAHFWSDVPGRSVTPPGHWDEVAEHLALQDGLSLEQNAHLFALLNIGLADAAINCWGAKYVYDFWRPVTAIRDPRASEINPATTSDPKWTPLWNTPNFPSYTSGHSTFSGAASTILAALFGPDTTFTIGSDDMPGYSRSFTSFAQAADEAGESRVVGGIHFAFDNTAGLQAGRDLGNYIAQNFLLPAGDAPRGARGQAGPVKESVLIGAPQADLLPHYHSGLLVSGSGADTAGQQPTFPGPIERAAGGPVSRDALLPESALNRHETRLSPGQLRDLDLLFSSPALGSLDDSSAGAALTDF